VLSGPTIARPVTARIARFAAKPRQIRVTWRPKGPFYFRKSALLRPLGKRKHLEIMGFDGVNQHRFLEAF
jgi:hypothetical protein